MKFETQNQKNINLYPERQSANISNSIDELLHIKNGNSEKIELGESEKEKFLEFEDKLGSSLESLYKINIASGTMYPEYFLTDTGKEDIEKIIGGSFVANNTEDVSRYFFENRELFKELPSGVRSDLFARSRKFADEKLLSEIVTRMDESGDFEVDDLQNPQRINILLSEEKALEKIRGLREFKEKLKKLGLSSSSDTSQNADSDNLKKITLYTLDLYKKRVNEMIASLFNVGVMVNKTKEMVGEENLAETEKLLLNEFIGLGEFQKNYSRYDRFIHGATGDYRSGTREQISQEIVDYAEALEEEYVQNEIEKPQNIKNKGLDQNKLFKTEIENDEFCMIGEEALGYYGQKSTDSSEEYYIEREGSATDGKWQFVSRSEFQSMGVDSKQRVVKSGTKNMSAYGLVAVLAGHEIEGHFVQALNKTRIPLRLMREVGGDRSEIIAEGGAMMIQDKITREAFGYKTIPHPYYVMAMMKKIEGGNYLDCVKAFYDSSRKSLVKKKEAGLISGEKFTEELRKNLELAINRVKRLYREGVDYDDKSGFLAKSKDTAYLEQLILLKKLQEKGMENFAYVGGCNLDTLVVLGKIGMLDLNKIEEPKLYSLQIWDKMKDRYKLEEKS